MRRQPSAICARHDEASKLLHDAELAESRRDNVAALALAKKGIATLGATYMREDVSVLDDTGQALGFAEGLTAQGDIDGAASLTLSALRSRLGGACVE